MGSYSRHPYEKDSSNPKQNTPRHDERTLLTVDGIDENLRDQHHSTISTFQAYSIAIDESTDIRNTAQLAIFIRGCDVNLKINEEFLEVIPMHNTTTEADIFDALMEVLETDSKNKRIFDIYHPVISRRVEVLMHFKSVEAQTSRHWYGVGIKTEVPAQVSSSSLDHGSKLRDQSPKVLV
ncbi:general transcription factor II-I repeat domain-containing protein 2 [Trichonephila clavipes]|nr:general transcription factor II-I repeat domain-containing protein 2 [Trichonephila clavipes]